MRFKPTLIAVGIPVATVRVLWALIGALAAKVTSALASADGAYTILQRILLHIHRHGVCCVLHLD